MAPALTGPRRKSFYKLLWPYMGEIFLAVATAYITTQMLADAGDIPAGSVGVANQVINMFYLVFQIISNGAGIVMAQSIGARTPGLKQKIATVSIFFAAILGLVGAIVIIFLGKPLLIAINIDTPLVELGSQYIWHSGFGRRWRRHRNDCRTSHLFWFRDELPFPEKALSSQLETFETISQGCR